MKAIYNRDNLFTNFPVFAYIAALNTTISDYSKLSNDATGVWYLPTNYDYEYEIFPAYWADDIAAGADSAVSTSTIGTSITNAGGTAFSYNGTSSIFVTSTEIASEVSNYRGISWRSSGADECAEASVSKGATSASNLVRAIMAFDFAE